MATARQTSAREDKIDLPLTPREKQVIALALAGFSSKESAERIGVSDLHIKKLLRDITAKLRVSNQLELVLFALHHQLTTPVQIIPRLAEETLSQEPGPKQLT
jgi:DNA-binding CsgD family transcriptional regulator